MARPGGMHGKSYDDLVRERGTAAPKTNPDHIADVLFKGGLVDKLVSCKACGQRNRVHANRGSARCAKCGLPLGEGTPIRIHDAMMDAPHDGEPYRQARAAMKATVAEQKPDAKRSFWRRIGDAWRVFWGTR